MNPLLCLRPDPEPPAPKRRTRIRAPKVARLRAASLPAVQRQATASAAVRSITAGMASNLTADWSTTPSHIHSLLSAYLKPIRARSRDRAINDDLGRRFIKQVKNNLVGPAGVVLQSQAVRPDGTPWDSARRTIEDGWRNWGRKGSCDATGKLSWHQAQNLWAETAATDGEVVVRKIKTTRYNPYGLTIQFIDAEQLPINPVMETSLGSFVLGIEIDKWGRPQTYHIQTADSLTYYSAGEYEHVPAEQILHGYIVERIGQLRGIPWMVSSLYRMKMLAGYIESSAVNARASAAQSGYFKRINPDAVYTGTEKKDSGAWLEDVEPGKHKVLPEGLEFQPYTPNFPQEQFPYFVQEMTRSIANGTGLFYNTFGNNYERINYSSGRIGILDERLGWMALQSWMIEEFHDPVYRDWLLYALANGALVADGRKLSIQDYDLLVPALYQPTRWPWVDPQKEVAAAVESIEADLDTESANIRMRGRDPEEVWRERAWELKRKREIFDEIAGDAPTAEQEEAAAPVDDSEESEVPDRGARSISQRDRRQNTQAFVYAIAQIEAGHYDLDSEWAFTIEDAEALDDEPGRYYLGVDPELEDEEIRWSHPTGKIMAGAFIVFKSALEEIRETANNYPSIYDAAGELIGLMETGKIDEVESGAIIEEVTDEISISEEEEDPYHPKGPDIAESTPPGEGGLTPP